MHKPARRSSMVARATFYDVVYTDAYVINDSDDPAPRVKFANYLKNSLTTGTFAHRDSGSDNRRFESSLPSRSEEIRSFDVRAQA